MSSTTRRPGQGRPVHAVTIYPVAYAAGAEPMVRTRGRRWRSWAGWPRSPAGGCFKLRSEAELPQVLDEIVADLRSQYVLDFTPDASGARPAARGRFREGARPREGRGAASGGVRLGSNIHFVAAMAQARIEDASGSGPLRDPRRRLVLRLPPSAAGFEGAADSRACRARRCRHGRRFETPLPRTAAFTACWRSWQLSPTRPGAGAALRGACGSGPIRGGRRSPPEPGLRRRGGSGMPPCSSRSTACAYSPTPSSRSRRRLFRSE